MSRLNDAINTFYKMYRESGNPAGSPVTTREGAVRSGDCHDEADSRRGAASDGYPVDKSQPEDPMSPGWNGPADDDDDEEEAYAADEYSGGGATSEGEEEVDYFPMDGSGGDASGKMAYKNGRKGDGPKGLRDTGRSRAPESEGDMDPGGLMGADASEARSKVKIRCPHCDEKNTVRLPKHLTVVRSAYAGEADASEGKILRTQCGKCDETVRFHAPEGHAFVRRTGEAQRHFAQRYAYLTGRGGNPITRGLRSAREAFRRSYYGK